MLPESFYLQEEFHILLSILQEIKNKKDFFIDLGFVSRIELGDFYRSE